VARAGLTVRGEAGRTTVQAVCAPAGVLENIGCCHATSRVEIFVGIPPKVDNTFGEWKKKDDVGKKIS
jgi:hypothetical protein